MVSIYVKDVDSNISNATGTKATLFAYENTNVITVRDSQDSIFNIGRIKEIFCPGFIKTVIIIIIIGSTAPGGPWPS